MSQFYWLTIGCIQSMELLGLKKVYGSNENNQLNGVVQQIIAYKMTNKIRVLVTFHSLAFGSTIDQSNCHMCLFCCGSYASYNVNFFIVFVLKYDYFYNYNILVSQVYLQPPPLRSPAPQRPLHLPSSPCILLR